MENFNNTPDGRYSDLHRKTIFDFCKDEMIINDIIIISKDAYLKELKSYPLLNAHTLIEYAEKTGNNALSDAVNKQYRKELEEENNE